MSMDLQEIKGVIYHWQSLFGSLIGAFIPIAFSIYLFSKEARGKREIGLKQIEIFLVHSINDLIEFRHEVKDFIERLDKIINELEKSDKKSYQFIQMNFPDYRVEYTSAVVLNDTRSIYLSNKLLRCYSMLQDLRLQMDSFRSEFKSGIDKSFQMALSYKDPAQEVGISSENQTRLLLEHLLSIRAVVQGIIFEKNIPTITKSITEARFVFLKYFSGKWPWFYRKYYEGLDGKISLREDGQELVERKFKKQIKEELEKLELDYKKRYA